MRNLSLISILLLILVACQNSEKKTFEHSLLQSRIEQLEQENRLLKDSISNSLEYELLSQIIVGIPDKKVLKVGEKNNVTFLFHKQVGEFPLYEIFKIQDGKEIKIGENNKTIFNYEFTPKSTNDNDFELLVKIPFNDKEIHIPINIIDLDIEE